VNRHRNQPLADGIARSRWFDAVALPDEEGMPSGCKSLHFCDIEIGCMLYPVPAIVAKVPTGVLLGAVFNARSGQRCFQVVEDGGFSIRRRKNNG